MVKKLRTRWWREADKRAWEGTPSVSGARRQPRRTETIEAWNVRTRQRLEAEAGLLGEGAYRARGRMGHDVGNVGRDGSLVGSDRGDAGSLDAVAA